MASTAPLLCGRDRLSTLMAGSTVDGGVAHNGKENEYERADSGFFSTKGVGGNFR